MSLFREIRMSGKKVANGNDYNIPATGQGGLFW